MTVAKFKI